mgnify:CR=1 FL=1
MYERSMAWKLIDWLLGRSTNLRSRRRIRRTNPRRRRRRRKISSDVAEGVGAYWNIKETGESKSSNECLFYFLFYEMEWMLVVDGVRAFWGVMGTRDVWLVQLPPIIVVQLCCVRAESFTCLSCLTYFLWGTVIHAEKHTRASVFYFFNHMFNQV